MTPHRVLLFGDQTVEKLQSIRGLVRISASSPALQRFLRKATDVVQTEVAKLSIESRKPFASFDSLLTLADETAEENADEIVATTLMCIVRLGELLLYAENDASILGDSNSVVHFLGLCTGLLPAAAAAVAKNTEDLIKFGIEIVAIAVRLAAGITSRSKLIEETPGSWAYTVVGATKEETQAIIDGFHRHQHLPEYRHVYVGVSSRTWTTIFGPPSVLERLWSYSPELGLAPKLKLAANAAVHAAHLPTLDLSTIIGQSPLLKTQIPVKARIISSNTCKPYVAHDLGHLLYEMIPDITQHTLLLTEMIEGLISCLQGKEEVDLIVVGPTAHTSLMQSALQCANFKVNLTHRAEKASPHCDIRAGSNLIAIVGMSGRFPGSDSVNQLWDTLQEGQAFHGKIPKSRFDLNAHFDPHGTLKNTTTTQYGCFLEHPGLFDSRLFNVSPREALQMDPVQRLLLISSYEALEMAGYTQNGSLSTDSKRIATYMAQATDDWRSINEIQGVDIYYVPGVARAFTPGRLNYHFKWHGASHSVDAACAGGTTAVHLACCALIARECDTALAGGGSILTAPNIYAGLSRGGFLSPTGGCKTFRDDADGYCRGEGVGVVVLKRLEDAIADNDNIQAVIKTSARTYSADAVSITQPHAETQVRLYKQVLHQASVDPADIGYIEAHGTGTQWGDLTEMQSIMDVFGTKRTKENPLVVGAVKANVGHGEAVAGITSLIKCAMILKKGLIPPQPGMPFQLNPKFPPLEKRHVRIAAGRTPFGPHPTRDVTKKILLNNFDAAGGNTCLILEDPPLRPQKGQDPRTYHVVVCSARTSYSLKENQRRLLQYLDSHPESKISDVAYTTTARRMHDVFRSSYIARTTQDLTQLIAKDLDDPTTAKTKAVSTRSSVIFAFTGQGSLYPDMGKQLFETCSSFRESILSFQKICDFQGLPLVADLFTDSSTDLTAKTTVQLQLGLIFLELALAALWKTWGVQPDLVIGHSLGEYAALCVSGVLSVSDTLYLVGRRASIMDEKCIAGSHAMLAVSAPADIIEDTLNKKGFSSCAISCRNAPDLSVVSGTLKDLRKFQQDFRDGQTKTKLLEVPYAFHSSQIDPILKEFGDSARSVVFAKPLVPVASTLTGEIVDNVGIFTPAYLIRQAREPVNFVGALRACKIRHPINEQNLWMEIGPGPVCLGMVRSSVDPPSTSLLPTIKSGEDNWKTISTSAAMAYKSKIPIAWTEYHQEYVKCLTLLELPSYAFDLKDYWASYHNDSVAPASNSQAASLSAGIQEKKRLSTTCLQYVEKECFEGDTISVNFSSHTTEPKLFDAIQGHMVDGTAICPASIFCDIAFSAARYIYSNAKGGKQVPEMSILSLEITHPLVVSVRNAQQMIEVNAVMLKSGDTVQVSFTSKAGSSFHEHGGCEIQFGKNDDYKNTFARTLHLVRRRIGDLTKSANVGLCHRLQRPIVYKLFASLVDYGDKYQGLEEVFMDSEYGDAAAIVKLRPSVDTGEFTQSPYWIDAIVHLAGFLLNGHVNYGDGTAFISTGFDALHIFEELSEAKTYSTYVSIQPTEKKDILSGDVYVLDGDVFVASCSGIHFHRMTRKVLRIIFEQSHTEAMPRKGRPVKPAGDDKSLKQPKLRSEKRQLPATPSSSSSEFKSSTRNTSPVHSVDEDKEPDKAAILLSIVSSESGFDLADMEPSTSFVDMGVDSLMSIAIISTAQKQMGLELPAGFFNEFPVVSDVRKELGRAPRPTNEHSLVAADDLPKANGTPQLDGSTSAIIEDLDTVQGEGDSKLLSIQSQAAHKSLSETEDKADSPQGTDLTMPVVNHHPLQEPLQEPSGKHFSHAVLIRGRSSSKEVPLFLVTDGAGSATAYIHLPPLPTGNPIYALESPFLHVPQQYNCSVEEICRMYCAAMRKIQPQGPYMIGGWSAGAVYAYEMTRQILEQNERVLSLFLIDMRVPRPMPDALEPTIALIESAGLFTGIDRSGQSQAPASQKLKQHLVSTVKALTRYQPIALNPSRRPEHSFVFWARRGLSESEGDRIAVGEEKEISGNIMEDPETGIKSWFYAKRSAFGPNGWDKLVGDIECFVVDGADHFSMVVPPKVTVLGKLLENSVKKCMDWKT